MSGSRRVARFIALVLSAAFAATTPRHTEAISMRLPTYTIFRTPDPIAIDGALDEPVWSRIKPVGAFMLHDGSKPAEFQTEAKLCWDDQYLYVAFSCIDTDIWGTYTKRDDPTYDEEVVEIFLNPTGNAIDYYELEVSPRNTIWDGKVHNPNNDPETSTYDDKWNCEGLLTAVQVDGTLDDRTDVDKGWTVEMAIPFAAIAQTPKDRERWRANLFRIDRGKTDEFSCWSPTQNPGQIPAFHIPRRFGHLVFSTIKG
jgi:hypothetical protein